MKYADIFAAEIEVLKEHVKLQFFKDLYWSQMVKSTVLIHRSAALTDGRAASLKNWNTRAFKGKCHLIVSGEDNHF